MGVWDQKIHYLKTTIPNFLHATSVLISLVSTLLLANYVFWPQTALWNIKKSKWINGPQLPYLRGIEDGCATLLNRTVVMFIGMTKLIGRKVKQQYAIEFYSFFYLNTKFE